MTEIEQDKLLSKIARLYYLEDMSQDKIAEKFNINRVRVSRYLKKARERDLVEIKIKAPAENYQVLERGIENTYGIRECIVVPDHDNAKDILRDMASALSNVFERTLKDGDYLGVNWGLTLKGVSQYLQPSRKINIKVVPMIGGIGTIETGIHTNSIAKSFADVFGGISYVINAPAILGNKRAKHVLMEESNTRELFELFKRLSIAVFSFSDLGPEASYVKYGSISEEELQYLESLGIVGDINLDFVNAHGEHVPNSISDRVIALPVSEIKRIRNIIGIAYGKRKGEITRAVLRGGILDVLIIDKNLADCVS